MGPPAKKRKLNGSTNASPATTRSLDFFFGKQSNGNGQVASTLDLKKEPKELSDEELARKLQAEWNQEDNGANVNTTVEREEPDGSDKQEEQPESNQTSNDADPKNEG
jgi:DNA ligase-1